MKRVLVLSLGALLLAAPVLAQVKPVAKPSAAKPAAAKPAAAKSMTAAGKVTAVVADSLTVKGKDAEWTFTVDKATTVVAKGASHKPAVITEFVKVGDSVLVKYHDMGATKHAATVTVHKAPAAPAKKK
jgi:hypothetical protein